MNSEELRGRVALGVLLFRGYTYFMVTPASLPNFFVPLTTPKATLAKLGGKGLNLVKLARANFPVPDGFIIPTACYHEFVQANHLNDFLRDHLAEADLSNPEALTALSQEIRTQFELGTVPEAIPYALEIAWRWLGAHPVAVRSSATAEDLPDLSFAGQQDTFLNVIGDEALLASVIQCWSSLWTARAIGYRARNGIAHQDVALAVIVQKMVQSQASGVLFTANPLTGCRDETVIDATLGLGEALVGGHVEPDHYVVHTSSDSHLLGDCHLASKSLGSKATLITGNPAGGVEIRPTKADQLQAIPDNIILELVNLGQQVQALYGFPQDIEWAYLPPSPPPPLPMGEGSLHILQSRPITSLYPLPDNLPMEPLRFMIGFHTVQGIMEPLTPLGQDVMKLVLTGGGQLFGLEHTLESQNAFFSAGERLWINVTPILRSPQGHKAYPTAIRSIDPGVAQISAELVKDPRFAPIHGRPNLRTIIRLAGFVAPFIGRVIRILISPEKQTRKVRRAFDEQVKQTQNSDVETGDIWQQFSARMVLLHQAKLLFSDFVIPQGVPPVVAGMAPFFGILQRFSLAVAEQTGDSQFNTLYLEVARGLPNNVTTEMDLALWHTAQSVRADIESFTAFENQSAEALTTRYLAAELPLIAQQVVGAFLAKYGMRGLGEIDIGRPRWREQPEHIFQTLKSYLQIDDPALAPDVVFARGTQAAQTAIEKLVIGTRNLSGGWFKARLVRWAAHRYRAAAGMREAPKFFAIRMMGIIREKLLQSGEDFAAAGLLERADDMFFLYINELDEISTFAKDNLWVSLREKIAQRRALRSREMQRRQIPRVLLSDGTAFYEGVASPEGNSDAIVGDPVSPGMVEGVVRVVLNPHGTQLEPGEILVCPGTDPAWTPLFLAAGGLVMEVGGMMTHGSVVAREYGIPAVVGVHQATTRLLTGQRVRVNGSSGRIELL